MGQVGAGFLERRDPVEAGHLAAAQAQQLREDEPHPVARLVTGPQFGDRPVDDVGLGRHEPLEVVGHVRQAPDPGGSTPTSSQRSPVARRIAKVCANGASWRSSSVPASS